MKIDYTTEVQQISGQIIDMATFQGKVLLICNTASRCGYTPQYAELEQLYRTYHAQGFEVLGFPCNQFGRQEPGSEKEILDFCQSEYSVSFQMFAKIRVNGDSAHTLFQQLKNARPGLLGTQNIRWNFTKFLVSRGGEVLARYGSNKSPKDLGKVIEKALTAQDGNT